MNSERIPHSFEKLMKWCLLTPGTSHIGVEGVHKKKVPTSLVLCILGSCCQPQIFLRSLCIHLNNEYTPSINIYYLLLVVWQYSKQHPAPPVCRGRDNAWGRICRSLGCLQKVPDPSIPWAPAISSLHPLASEWNIYDWEPHLDMSSFMRFSLWVLAPCQYVTCDRISMDLH